MRRPNPRFPVHAGGILPSTGLCRSSLHPWSGRLGGESSLLVCTTRAARIGALTALALLRRHHGVEDPILQLLEKCCAVDREADEFGLAKPEKKFIMLKRRGDPGQVLVHPPVPPPPMVTEIAYLEELDRQGSVKLKAVPSGPDSFAETEAGRAA